MRRRHRKRFWHPNYARHYWLTRILEARKQRKAYEAMWDAEMLRIAQLARDVRRG